MELRVESDKLNILYYIYIEKEENGKSDVHISHTRTHAHTYPSMERREHEKNWIPKEKRMNSVEDEVERQKITIEI